MLTYPDVVAARRHSCSRVLVALVAVCCVTMPARGQVTSGEVDGLLDGVDRLMTGGNPATMVTWGDAEPLSVADDGRIFAAASTLGEGRVVALGHGGYIGAGNDGTMRFVANAIEWLAGEGTDLIRLAGAPRPASLARLEERGRTIEPVRSDPGSIDLAGCDVLIASPQAFAGAGRLAELEAWVRDGGGLLVVETAWGQLQLGRAASLADLAANRLLTDAGIGFTEAAASPVRDGGYPGRPVDAAEAARRAAANAERALETLASGEGETAFAARIAREALALVPLDGPLIAEADRLAIRHADALERAWVHLRDHPLRPSEHPLAVALMDLDARRAALLPADQVAAHPSAPAFPGPIDAAWAEANDGEHVLRLDASIPGWRTTGFYALPGQPVTVRFTGSWGEVAAASTGGLAVQIGVWQDPQLFADRVRLPRGMFRTAVTDAITRAASPIGGPLILDLPEAFTEGRNADDPLDIVITGAVPMPRYRLGHTDLDEWRDEIRSRPVPWAEMESDELVFSVPAAVVRDLDRPDLVMEHWDRVHGAMQGLQPRSPRHWPTRQYRYVCERRLSWGYMYCPVEAPIVIPMTAADEMMDLTQYDGEGGHQLWGHYHEMGHAHQDPMWTFGGTVEVTVNIFTVYALNQVNGYPIDSDAMRSNPATAWRTFTEHRAKGAPFDEWRRRPFLALQTYAMLWHAFGWEAYHRVFRAYEALPAAERPRTDAEKRDRWLVMMSRAVGHDLGPYFDAWGVPVSEAAKAEVTDLPVWMPEAPAADRTAGTS